MMSNRQFRERASSGVLPQLRYNVCRFVGGGELLRTMAYTAKKNRKNPINDKIEVHIRDRLEKWCGRF